MWFAENSWPQLAVCAVLAGLFAARWMKTGERRSAWALAATVVAGVAFWGYAHIVESPGEAVGRQVRAWRDACASDDVVATLGFVSPQSVELRAAISAGMALINVHDDVRITDLQVELSSDQRQAQSHFRANGMFTFIADLTEHRIATRWIAVWDLTDTGWQVIELQRLNPISGEPMGILDRRQT